MTHHQGRRITGGGHLLALLALFLVIGPVGALATTWNVSPSSGGTCTLGDASCKTIQGAINASSPGDTINVYPGLYSETANVPSPPACAGDTVGLYISSARSGITIRGVSAIGTPITDAKFVAATVNTISNLCFGPDGIFVEGDNVTIAGLQIGTNTGGQNKTIEIVGDNFTLKDCDIADVQGSVYINDFNATATTSHVQSYTIRGNLFEDGVSLDINNGAGLSGDVTGRAITRNTFKNLATAVGAEPWPSVSFTGSDTGVPWFVNSVGGAVISANTFTNSAPDGQLIRVRGTYDNSQFDWASYWNTNTFNKAVMVGPNPPVAVETYSYPNSYGTFSNVRRIGAVIQGEVDHAQPTDTVMVAAGTYTENVVISTPLMLSGAGQTFSIIEPALSNPNPVGCSGSLCGGAASNIILVQADNVTITGLMLDGDNPALTSGVVVGGADLDARNAIITNHSLGTYNGLEVHHVTVQNVYLRGMYASSGGTFNFHDNTVANVQAAYASIAMFNFGGSGIMARNTVTDANDAISANWSGGTQFLNNTITNSGSGVHTDNAGGFGTLPADLIQDNRVTDCMAGGYGVFVFVPYVAPTVQGNTITNCAVGLAMAGGLSTPVMTLFEDNIVDAAHSPGSTGIYVTTSEFGWGTGNVSATFTNNQVLDATDGFFVQDKTCSATTTQSCSVDTDCPTGETCLVGSTITMNASCNLISGNDTGISTGNLSAPANAVFTNNSIIDNTTGADGTAIASGRLNARNNWWGCVTGPNTGSCESVTGNVDVSAFATSAPACVTCLSNADCDDGLKCNGTETCDLSTHTCVAGSPPICTLGSASPQCNEAVCIEPAGCTVEPSLAGTVCECSLASCPTTDKCDGAGTCVSPGTWKVSSATLRVNTWVTRSDGRVTVIGSVDDTGSGGMLTSTLLSNTVKVDVGDSGTFQTTLALTGCRKVGSTISCRSSDRKTTAQFKAVRKQPNHFTVRLTKSGLGTADTGYRPAKGPVALDLHEGVYVRGANLSACTAKSPLRLVCSGS